MQNFTQNAQVCFYTLRFLAQFYYDLASSLTASKTGFSKTTAGGEFHPALKIKRTAEYKENIPKVNLFAAANVFHYNQ